MRTKLLTVSACMFFSLSIAQTVPLTIEVENIQVGKGDVVVSLYSGEKNFFKTPLVSQAKQANEKRMKYLINIPMGVYAIAVFQDLDKNGKLTLGWFNIPKEPVGLGNDFKPTMSAPKFKDCAVSVSNTNNHFIIKLN